LSDTEAQAITGGVCYCCKTSVVAHGSSVYGAWRHVYPGSIRDIALTVSRDGGRTFTAPVRVSDDGWKIDGCPENGPALAVDDDARVHVVWVTPPDGKSDTPLEMFYAASNDGASFTDRVKVPTSGQAGHAQIAALSDGSLLVAWDEAVNSKHQVGFARARRNAATVPEFERFWTGVSIEGRSPVLAATGRGGVAGWVSGTGTGSAIVIARVR
jgi:hypothetical protein